MSTAISFEAVYSEANHLFHTRRYTDAYQKFFLIENQGKLSQDQRCQLLVLQGKCLFSETYQETRPTLGIYGPMQKNMATGGVSEPRQFQVTVRKSGPALKHFQEALKLNPNHPDALFWQGEALNSQRETRAAYDSYAQAANLGIGEARQKCIVLFRNYDYLPFKATRKVKDATQATLRSLGHAEPYLRYEALLDIQDSLQHSQVRAPLCSSVRPLAGIGFWNIYLPISGDQDNRVCALARRIIRQYDN